MFRSRLSCAVVIALAGTVASADHTFEERTRTKGVIRRAERRDVDAIWTIRSQPGVCEWLSSAAEDRSAFEERLCTPERLAKIVVVESDDQVIGDAMISVKDGWAQAEVSDEAIGVEAELGWVLDPAHRGQGYAVEVVQELFRLCFDELGLRRVTANCFADNEVSWRLMERVGMRREAHSRADGLHRSGAWLDGMSYALLAGEWRAARPG
jgi:RimJ/RimL family protein N-acetyltransferase